MIALLGALTSLAAAAQAPGDSAIVRGTVYDSLLTAGPLGGAEVWLEGTNRTVRTDPQGRFEFGRLRPGRYTLTFYHPVLDSSRLSARPVTVVTEPGQPGVAHLATPSPRAVHTALCPRDPRRNTGVVLGLVRDGPGGSPLADAVVTAEWTMFDLGGANRWEPQRVAARSDSSGRVVLCTVPTDVVVLVSGQTAGGGPAGMLSVDLAGRSFGRIDLDLARNPSVGAVIGVVRTRSGAAVPGTIVMALGSGARTEVDASGRFLLREVASGSRIIEARAIGYEAARVQTSVSPGQVERVSIELGDSVQVLEPITVTARSHLETIGFERRRKAALGHFLDTTDIARTGAARMEEVFRLVPGILLRPSGMGYIVEFQRGQGQVLNPRLSRYCQPSYYIDGGYFPLPPNATVTLPVVPAEVLAIEVYSNLFSAPQQYQRRDSGCGIILIWTRRGVPNQPK
ncbi:MAG: carboxypeptidase regulatory-like domain-containing protein [Gemmatimonadales bacterium]